MAGLSASWCLALADPWLRAEGGDEASRRSLAAATPAPLHRGLGAAGCWSSSSVGPHCPPTPAIVTHGVDEPCWAPALSSPPTCRAPSPAAPLPPPPRPHSGPVTSRAEPARGQAPRPGIGTAPYSWGNAAPSRLAEQLSAAVGSKVPGDPVSCLRRPLSAALTASSLHWEARPSGSSSFTFLPVPRPAQPLPLPPPRSLAGRLRPPGPLQPGSVPTSPPQLPLSDLGSLFRSHLPFGAV